jgi:SAM-dependent methyltransferase
MPKFKSQQEAWEAHKHYRFDTDHEGKFTPRHTGWLRTQQLLDWIPDDSPVFLGIGCNTGGLEALIMRKRKGSIAYGIDICAEAIERAVRKGILARVGTAEVLPYKDNFFDIVILSEILEHVFNPRLVLKESLRVLKPGGLIIGSVPHPRGLNTKKRPIEKHEYHARVFTRQKLNRLLSILSNLEIKEIPFHHCDVKIPQWFTFYGRKSD